MTLTEVFIIGLASWRLTSLLLYEEGPARIFNAIRLRILPVGELYGFSYFRYKIFTCFWCMSVWTTTFVTVVWIFWPIPVIVLASTTVVIFLERLNEMSEQHASIHRN